MPQPIFSNNPADWTAVEGLAISETLAPAGIKGVALNRVGIIGECVRGPADKPVYISSPSRFEEVFGGRDKGSGGSILGQVWKALLNKPFGPLWIVRAAPAAAVKATRNLVAGATAWTRTITFDTKANHGAADTFTIDDGVNDPITFELDKAGDGVVSGNIAIDISGATTAQDVAVLAAAAVNVKVTAELLRLDTVATPIAGAMVLVGSVLGTVGNVTLTESGAATLGTNTAGTDTTIATLTANGPGTWGNDVSYEVQDASDGDADHFNLEVTYLGKARLFEDLDVSAADVDNILTVMGDDDGLIVSLAKVASGRPDNAQPYSALASGTDGSIADSDFTASNRGINLLSAKKGVNVVAVAGRSNSVIKAYLKTKAAAAPDRLFLACPDAESTSAATAQAEAATLTTGGKGRLVYAFNHAKTLDPETATKVWTEPHMWMASILSQLDVDENPGVEAAKKFTAGITELYFPSLERSDYVAMREAGIAAIEEDAGGFVFVSGITTDLVEIADRRGIDFLNISVADRTRHEAKKKSTERNRRALIAPIIDFFTQLVKDERVLEAFLVDGEALNTPTTRGQNIERVLLRGRLISHMNFIVAETEYGTSVEIASAA